MTHAQRLKALTGLYGIADSSACGNEPVTGIRQLLDGGCRIVQLRCKDWSVSDIEAAAVRCVELCRDVDALFILNDYPEIAAAVDADGVHVGQRDGALSTVREIVGPNRLIGLTTNDPAHLNMISPEADYVSYGPIWDSSRAGSHKQTQRLDRFKQAVSMITPRPVVAIGGIRRERIAEVRDAGATAWAVIGAVFNQADPVAATRDLLGQ